MSVVYVLQYFLRSQIRRDILIHLANVELPNAELPDAELVNAELSNAELLNVESY
jgi:hypothetical protein